MTAFFFPSVRGKSADRVGELAGPCTGILPQSAVAGFALSTPLRAEANHVTSEAECTTCVKC